MDEVDAADHWMGENWKEVETHRGKWVAVSRKGIAGIADNLKELARLKAVNLNTMIVMRVPTVEQSNAIWVLNQHVGRKNISL